MSGPEKLYDPEFDSPEARANYGTRHIFNLGERLKKRQELRRQFESEEVESGLRPDYKSFLSPEHIMLMRAKGNVRRKMIESHLKTGGFESIPEAWRSHDLEPDLKDALGAQHPQARGGEDLPDLFEGEAEIARLSLVNSVHGEVTSLRVQFDPDANLWRLRLVDEYGTEFVLPTDAVECPLAPFEVLECFQKAKPSPLETSCRVSFSSLYYPDLDGLAAQLGIAPRES